MRILSFLAFLGCADAYTLQRVNLDLKRYPEAKCMDGSAGLYYTKIRPNSKVGLIYLHGGGYCSGTAECELRDLAHKSATGWPQSEEITQGIMSDNCQSNPDFCEASVIYVAYCSSDVHSGNADPSPGQPFYFKGKRIVAAVLEEIDRLGHFNSAERILLMGTSAGGVGSLNNCDVVGERFAGKKVSCLNDAGTLMSSAPYDAACPTTSSVDVQHAFTLWNASYNKACEAAVAAKDRWTCASSSVALPFLEQPVFFAQNELDTVQIQLACFDPFATSLSDSWYQGFATNAAQTMKALKNIQTKPGVNVGVYSPSCQSHVQSESDSKFKQLTINGVTLQASLSQWWKGQNVVHVEDCSGDAPCNKLDTCRGAPDHPKWCKKGVATHCRGKTGSECETCAKQQWSTLSELCTETLSKFECRTPEDQCNAALTQECGAARTKGSSSCKACLKLNKKSLVAGCQESQGFAFCNAGSSVVV